MLPVVITLNNYLHDLATALLAASAVMMLGLLGALGPRPSADVSAFVLRVYPKLTLLAKVSLVWILVGGVPRALYFSRVEWLAAWGNGIVTALAVKHVLMASVVIAGALGWRRLARRYEELSASLADTQARERGTEATQ